MLYSDWPAATVSPGSVSQRQSLGTTIFGRQTVSSDSQNRRLLGATGTPNNPQPQVTPQPNKGEGATAMAHNARTSGLSDEGEDGTTQNNLAADVARLIAQVKELKKSNKELKELKKSNKELKESNDALKVTVNELQEGGFVTSTAFFVFHSLIVLLFATTFNCQQRCTVDVTSTQIYVFPFPSLIFFFLSFVPIQEARLQALRSSAARRRALDGGSGAPWKHVLSFLVACTSSLLVSTPSTTWSSRSDAEYAPTGQVELKSKSV